MMKVGDVLMHKHSEATKVRSVSEIAREIKRCWSKPYYGAVPYINAMESINCITDRYYYDTAESVVRYFLANANNWRGADARRIKDELRAMVASTVVRSIRSI